MPFARACVLLFAAALALESTACATILRPARAELVFTHAPDDLKALDEDGAPLAVEKQPGGSATSQIGYKTRNLTLTSGDDSAKVELGASASVGYVVIDIILYLVPAVVDFATSKWTNFEAVDVRAVFDKAKLKPPSPPSNSRELPLPDVAVVSGPRANQPLLQPARNDPALIQPASRQQTLLQPGQPADRPPERRAPMVTSGKLAVLDFRSYTDALKPEDVRYFTDLVRGATLKASPSLQVMTRENLLVLLQANGKDAANCEGECEVDTGRRIGADAVVSGEILKVGSHFKLSLKLHETRDGRLLSTAVASGKTIDELDDSAQAAVIELITPTR